jgi:hypothetical protein
LVERKGQRSDVAERRRELNRRLRLAFVAGAEARSRETVGRGLTADELRRVIERYAGDVADRSGGGPAV